MRDMFEGQELAQRSSKAGGAVGLAIMVGPLLESIMLKMAKVGNEHIAYLGLVGVGSLTCLSSSYLIPETLAVEKQKQFDVGEALKSCNPFSFFKLYTDGTPAVRNLSTIVMLQTMCDGKNVSDLTQLWTREHLKLSMETIRNFVMGYGFASMMAGAKLGPALL